MRKACQYAIVRFLPFIETGEFANVGIVLLCSGEQFFGFRLLSRHDRIVRFFDGMDERVYTEARRFLDGELDRVRVALETGPFKRRPADVQGAQSLFHELVRSREALMRFDTLRAVLADDPQATLDELYGLYVERNIRAVAEPGALSIQHRSGMSA